MTWKEYQKCLLMAEAKSRERRNVMAKEQQEAGGTGVATQSSQTTAKLAEKSIGFTCPECGIPNPVSRVTCEICHARLYPKPKKEGGIIMDEMARELYGMNKKLKIAMVGNDQKLAAKVRGQIKAAAAKSGGVFKVGENGLATQAKSTTPKVKKERTPKKVRNCPCCNQEVGGYFAMGHDGRVHGMLLKIKLEKMKLSEAPKGVQAMYEIFKKNTTLSMKEIAQRLEK